jgi:1,4-dihydroxy-2-naphthoate octaprenyltransferase
LALGALVDWRIVVVGAACMAVALLYSGGPLPISRLPVGELFGGLLGIVLIAVAAFVQSRSLDPRIWWLGVPSCTLIATILSVNNACDVDGDRKPDAARWQSFWDVKAERMIHLQAVATLLFAFALVPPACCPQGARGAGWPDSSVARFARLHRRGFSHVTKAAAMGGVSAVFLVYTLAILVAIGMGAMGLP